MKSTSVPLLQPPALYPGGKHLHVDESAEISSNSMFNLSLDKTAPSDAKSNLPVRADEEEHILILPNCNSHCNPIKHDCAESSQNATFNENIQQSFEASTSHEWRMNGVTRFHPIPSEPCVCSPKHPANPCTAEYDVSSPSAGCKAGFLEVNMLRNNQSNYTDDYSTITAKNIAKENHADKEVPSGLSSFRIKHDKLGLQAPSTCHDTSAKSEEHKYERFLVKNDMYNPENMKSKYATSPHSDNSNIDTIVQDHEEIECKKFIEHNKLPVQTKMADDALEAIESNIKYLPLQKNKLGVCDFHSNNNNSADIAKDITSNEFHKASSSISINNDHLNEIRDERLSPPYENPKSEQFGATHEHKRFYTLQYPQDLRYANHETTVTSQIDSHHTGEYNDRFHMHRYLHYQLTPNHLSKGHHHYCHPSQLPTRLLVKDEGNLNPSSGHNISVPVAKAENQDDGYETSAGDALTPNSHISSPSTSCSSQPTSTLRSFHQPCRSALANVCDIRAHKNSNSELIFNNENSVKVESKLNFDESYIHKKSEIRAISPLIKTNLENIRPCFTQSNEDLNENMNYSNHSESAREMLNGGLLTKVNCNTDIHNTDHHAQIVNKPSDMHTAPLLPEAKTKKRGRKKKIRDENGSRISCLNPTIRKERKKHDRFNGMSEEQISKRTLPDHLTENLDIIVIGINPGLFAAYKGHYYAGPGNHFWKCLHLSGLINEQMSAEEDYKLLDFGIGFTNMVQRPTKGSADLTRKEIKEGSQILLDKIRRFRPKIAVFNGKLIFEVFSGKKDFLFGRQDDFVDGTNTYMWVMPSSSARCAQLPRAADKVPFYAALKKFRDYLNGLISNIDESDCVFNDPKYRTYCENETKLNSLMCKDMTDLPNENFSEASINLTVMINDDTNIELDVKTTGKRVLETCSLPLAKKKRGRPKKYNHQTNVEKSGTFKGDYLPPVGSPSLHESNHNDDGRKITDLGILPKKKRGRPKKVKTMLVSNNENTCNELRGINALEKKCVSQGKDFEIHSNEKMNTRDCVPIARMDPVEDVNKMYHHPDSSNQSRLFSSMLHSPSTVGSSYCSFATNMDTSYTSSVNLHANPNLNSLYTHYSDQIGQQNRKQIFHNPDSYESTFSSHSEFVSEITPIISTEGLSHLHLTIPPSIGSAGYFRSPRMNELGSEEPRCQNQVLMDENNKRAPETIGGDYNPYSVNSDNYFSSLCNIPRTTSDSTNESNLHNPYLRIYNTPPATNHPKDRSTDVSAKSLSVLESLVHQIPAFPDVLGASSQRHLIHEASLPARILPSSLQPISDSANGFINASTELFQANRSATNYSSSTQYQSLITVSPSASPLVTSVNPTTPRLISPQHNFASHISYSTSSEFSSSSAPKTSISTGFTISSSNDSSKSNIFSTYGRSSSSTNCHSSMALPTSNRTDLITGHSPSTSVHQHISSSTFGDSTKNSPMHAEQSQAFLPVNSLYNAHQMNSYVNYGVYQGCNSVSQNMALVPSNSTISSPSPIPSPVLQSIHPPISSSLPTLQLPSSNYPHGYNHSSMYTSLHYPAPHHHPVPMHHPTSATAFLTPHSGVFECLRSDYGGF